HGRGRKRPLREATLERLRLRRGGALPRSTRGLHRPRDPVRLATARGDPDRLSRRHTEDAPRPVRHPVERHARPLRHVTLVVTADDLGLSPGVTKGILESHRRGVVRSTSLIVTADSSAEAAALARMEPDLEVGLHIDLVGGWPVSDPAAVRSLVDSDGRFLGLADLTKRLFSGRVRAATPRRSRRCASGRLRRGGRDRRAPRLRRRAPPRGRYPRGRANDRSRSPHRSAAPNGVRHRGRALARALMPGASTSAALNRAVHRYRAAPLGARVFVHGRAFLSDLAFVERFVPRQGFIVDLGCGHGLFACLLREAAESRRVLGIDLDDRKIEVARGAALAMFERAGFVVEVEEMPRRPYTDIAYLARKAPLKPSPAA